MALQGHVRVISLLEVFELLARSRTLGVLTIRRGSERRVVYLKDGRIFGMRGARRDRRQLGAILHQQGKLDMPELMQCLEAQEQSGRTLGTVIVERGCASREDVDNALRLQLEERLFEPFLWDDASYSFAEGKAAERMEGRDAISIPLNTFVMGVARRLDEWRRLVGRVPTPRTILRLATASEVDGEVTPEDRVASLVVQRGLSFDPELISGHRPVEALLELSGTSQEQTASLLHELVVEGAVVPLPLDEALQLFDQAVKDAEWERALAYLRHLQSLGLERARLRELGNRLFGDVRLGRSGVTGTYTPQRSGIAILELAYQLTKSGVKALLEATHRGESTSVLFGPGEIALEVSGREVLQPVLDDLHRRSGESEDFGELLRNNRRRGQHPAARLLLASNLIEKEELEEQCVEIIFEELVTLALSDNPTVLLRLGNEVDEDALDCNACRLELEPDRLREVVGAPLFALLARARSVPTLDLVPVRSRRSSNTEVRTPVIRSVDGQRSLRQLLDESPLPPHATFEALLRGFETWKIRPLDADELLDLVENMLTEGRTADALRLCRGAIEQDVDPEVFEQLAAVIVQAHGDLTAPREQHHLTVDLARLALADVLQSLHLHKKTGTLRVWARGQEAEFYLQDGDLVHMMRAGENPEVAVLLVDVERKAAEGRKTGTIRIAGRLLDESEAPVEVVQAAQDAILDVFLWEGATLEFRSGELPERYLNPPADTLKLKLAPDRFLMQVIGALGRWSAVREIYKRRSGLTFASPEAESEARKDESLLEIADAIAEGSRLMDVLTASPFSIPATLEILHELHERELIRPMTLAELSAGGADQESVESTD